MSDMIPTVISPSLLNYLKCPCCEDVMSEHISICTMGHSICEPCSKHLQNCPSCGMLFQGGRNYTLEHLLDYLDISCIHKSRGCRNNMQVRRYREHEQACAYRTRNCFSFLSNIQCDWEGMLSDMPAHFKNKHPKLVMKNEGNSLKTWDFYHHKFGINLVSDEYFLISACLSNGDKENLCFAMVPANLAFLQENQDFETRRPHKISGVPHTWDLDFSNFQIQHGCFQDGSFLDVQEAIDNISNYDVCLNESNFQSEFLTGLLNYRVKVQKPPSNNVQFFVPMS